MELKISHESLLAELSLALGAVETKATLPMSGMVKLEATADHLILTTTNTEIGFMSRVPAEVKKPGKILLNAKKLTGYAGQLQGLDESVTLKATESRVSLKCGRNSSRMPFLDAEDFPALPKRGPAIVTFTAGEISKMFSRVGFAILGGQDGRFDLQGAQLIIEPGKQTAVGTDGKRMSVAFSAASSTAEKRTQYILPRKSVGEVSKLSGKLPEDSIVNVYSGDGYLYFGFGSRLIYARGLAGAFPGWERGFPAAAKAVAVISASELASTIGRVSEFGDDRSRAVNLSFESNSLSINANSQENGDSEEAIEVSYAGEPMKIRLNAQYLLDLLRIAGDSQVELHAKAGAAMIEMGIVNDSSFRYAIATMG